MRLSRTLAVKSPNPVVDSVCGRLLVAGQVLAHVTAAASTGDRCGDHPQQTHHGDYGGQLQTASSHGDSPSGRVTGPRAIRGRPVRVRIEVPTRQPDGRPIAVRLASRTGRPTLGCNAWYRRLGSSSACSPLVALLSAPAAAQADIDLPDGFATVTLASGLVGPTAFAYAPDGRIFIAEKPAASGWCAPAARRPNR